MSITIASVVGGIAALAIWALSRPAPGTREAKLINNDENQPVDIDEVASKSCLLVEGPFVLRTFRQSGNLHQDDRFFDEPDSAIRAAISTFRHAKIDLIVIMDNTPNQFSFRRAVPDFRGRNEGKKVRWIEIHRLQRDGSRA